MVLCSSIIGTNIPWVETQNATHLYKLHCSHNLRYIMPFSSDSDIFFSNYLFIHPINLFFFVELMPYSLRKKSCIPAYQNYIPCGKQSCKINCNKDNIHCNVCNKLFHYKCIGLTKKVYLQLMDNNKGTVCSNACYRTLLPFYLDVVGTKYQLGQLLRACT